jgi:hypothetical protein
MRRAADGPRGFPLPCPQPILARSLWLTFTLCWNIIGTKSVFIPSTPRLHFFSSCSPPPLSPDQSSSSPIPLFLFPISPPIPSSLWFLSRIIQPSSRTTSLRSSSTGSPSSSRFGIPPVKRSTRSVAPSIPFAHLRPWPSQNDQSGMGAEDSVYHMLFFLYRRDYDR